jgi:hypothetical protein
MKKSIASLILVLLNAEPALALFSTTEYEIETPQAIATVNGVDLKRVPNAPLRIAISRKSPVGVLNPDTQIKILDGISRTQEELTAPNELSSEVEIQEKEPIKIEFKSPAVRFRVSIPAIIQSKTDIAKANANPGIGENEYIPRGGLARSAERVMADPVGAAALVDIANHLGLDPTEFIALMSWESGGTLNPNVLGGDKNSYKGLIQFSPGNAKKYGVAEQISISQYAPAIKEYLLHRGFKPGEHKDIRYAYSAILAGRAGQKYWGRKDSNGTNVWNAEKHFKSGVHYERAKAFLEASLKEMPASKPQQYEIPEVALSF